MPEQAARGGAQSRMTAMLATRAPPAEGLGPRVRLVEDATRRSLACVRLRAPWMSRSTRVAPPSAPSPRRRSARRRSASSASTGRATAPVSVSRSRRLRCRSTPSTSAPPAARCAPWRLSLRRARRGAWRAAGAMTCRAARHSLFLCGAASATRRGAACDLCKQRSRFQGLEERAAGVRDGDGGRGGGRGEEGRRADGGARVARRRARGGGGCGGARRRVSGRGQGNWHLMGLSGALGCSAARAFVHSRRWVCVKEWSRSSRRP